LLLAKIELQDRNFCYLVSIAVILKYGTRLINGDNPEKKTGRKHHPNLHYLCLTVLHKWETPILMTSTIHRFTSWMP
jgi:hypothetical protein